MSICAWSYKTTCFNAFKSFWINNLNFTLINMNYFFRSEMNMNYFFCVHLFIQYIFIYLI